MLNYTLSSLHPGRVKVTPLQWPTRGKKSLDFSAGLFPPAPDRAKETSAVGELGLRGNNIWCQNCIYLLGASCAGICHWSHWRGAAFFTLSFFKVCSKAKSSLRTGRDFCSGGIFPDSMCAVSLIVSSGFVSMELDRRTKPSWAVAHDMAFCAGILSCPCGFFTAFPSQSHLVPILTRIWGSGHAWLRVNLLLAAGWFGNSFFSEVVTQSSRSSCYK